MLCWEKSSTFCVQSIDIDPDVVHPLSFTSNQSLLNKSKRLTRRTAAADAADARNIKKGTLAGMDTRLCAFVMAVFILRTR